MGDGGSISSGSIGKGRRTNSETSVSDIHSKARLCDKVLEHTCIMHSNESETGNRKKELGRKNQKKKLGRKGGIEIFPFEKC